MKLYGALLVLFAVTGSFSLKVVPAKNTPAGRVVGKPLHLAEPKTVATVHALKTPVQTKPHVAPKHGNVVKTKTSVKQVALKTTPDATSERTLQNAEQACKDVKKGGKVVRTCKPQQGDVCSKQVTCGQCTLKGCGFNKQKMSCQKKTNNPLLITGNEITVPTACLPIDQMQELFPARVTSSKGKPGQQTVTKPGVISAQVHAILNSKLLNHIFKGSGIDSTTPVGPTAGRHIRSAFLKDNSHATVVETNTNAHITDFEVETVWDDGPGDYDQQDIINMCAVAIQATKTDKTVKKAAKVNNGSRVVQTKFGVPICIKWFSGGSCFPLGTKEPTGKKLGEDCKGNNRGKI